MYVGTKQMKIPHFIMLKGVCHKVVIVKGGRANDDEGWRRGEGGSAQRWRKMTKGGGGVSQKMTKDDRGGGGGLSKPKIGWHNMWTAPN